MVCFAERQRDGIGRKDDLRHWEAGTAEAAVVHPRETLGQLERERHGLFPRCSDYVVRAGPPDGTSRTDAPQSRNSLFVIVLQA